MARLNPTQQAAKMSEARRLAQQGYSRRQINPILKQKYGEGIRPAKYMPIYRERVATTGKQVERRYAIPRQPERQPEPQVLRTRKSTALFPRYKNPRTRQSQFRWYLRDVGFVAKEADEFSKYRRKYSPPGGGRKVMVPVIRELIEQRRALKQAFMLEVKSKGWGAEKANDVYISRINAIYEDLERRRNRGGMMGKFLDAPFVWKDVHGRPYRDKHGKPEKRINPWALKEATFLTLPEADQWETPRSHWNKPQTAWSTSPAARQFNKKSILDEIRVHKRDIASSGDPTGWHETAILGLQFRLKEGLY